MRVLTISQESVLMSDIFIRSLLSIPTDGPGAQDAPVSWLFVFSAIADRRRLFCHHTPLGVV